MRTVDPQYAYRIREVSTLAQTTTQCFEKVLHSTTVVWLRSFKFVWHAKHFESREWLMNLLYARSTISCPLQAQSSTPAKHHQSRFLPSKNCNPARSSTPGRTPFVAIYIQTKITRIVRVHVQKIIITLTFL